MRKRECSYLLQHIIFFCNAPHGVQTLNAVPVAHVPAAQDAQLLPPVVACILPTVHAEQTEEPPIDANLPIAQSVQIVWDVSALNLPAAQSSQASWPAFALYFPISHGEHLLPVTYLPGRQFKLGLDVGQLFGWQVGWLDG